MNNEWQVTNLELSKRLKELNFKQDSLWYWIFDDGVEQVYQTEYGAIYDQARQPEWILTQLSKENMPTQEELEHISAYTVAESWDILPNEIDNGKGNYFKTIEGQRGGYKSVTGEWLFEIQGTMLLSERLAKMLIYLAENNLIKGLTNE